MPTVLNLKYGTNSQSGPERMFGSIGDYFLKGFNLNERKFVFKI
jgi:hypothetical protein